MAATATAKPLTYGDLPTRTGQSGPVSVHAVFLFCPKCGNRYSCERGDYFWQPADAKVTCADGHRGFPMILAREQVRIIPVEPDELAWMAQR